MNDARRQLLHESFKLIDLSIMLAAFVVAAWLASHQPTPLLELPGEGFRHHENLGVSAQNGSQMGLSPSPLGLLAQPPREASLNGFLEGLNGRLTATLIGLLTALVVAWNATFTSRGLYNSRRMDSSLVEALDVLRASALGTLIVVVLAGPIYQAVKAVDPALASHLHGVETDRWSFLIFFFVMAAGATIITRLLIRNILERARLHGRNLRGVLIIGTNHRALRFAESIKSRPEMGYFVVGFVDEEWDGIAGFKKGGGQLVANLKDLGEFMANEVVDEVVVALPVSSAYIYSSRIVSLCQEQGITVRFISQIFDSRLAKGRLEVFGGEPMLSLEASPDEGFARLVKKIVDRMVAATLLLLVSPLFGLVALMIRLTSPGPVLFVQTRVGLNKRKFKLYKFRTMVADAEAQLKDIEHLNQVAGPVFKIEKDPRVTPLGEFLRKSSIDELPQLWNVVKGDMSLVGPRPLPERDYQGFDVDAHRRRLSVRPGLTCIWQVSGRNSIPFERWMEMDLEYIDNWTLWLDGVLLAKTIPVVLGPLLFFRRGEFVKGRKQASETEPAVTNSGQTP